MFVTLASAEAGNRIPKGFKLLMATSTNGSKSSTAKTKTKTPAEKSQARSVAETAVDIPVGAVLTVTERVTELFEPFSDRSGAEKQLKSYRTELRRRVKRTERRGATARRRATSEARKTRNRVEREARKRQRTVETTLKRNRNELEQRVRKAVDFLPV
jgi:predicted  nucleic acid-binding Zn-ribbon protein